MKDTIILIFFISILSSCNETKSKEVSNKKNQSITYELGLENCKKIKEQNPDNYFHLLNDCMAGSQMPEFRTKSIDGTSIDLNGLKGKLSVINFWFTTCPPCIAEIPGLNLIVDKFGSDNVNFISIARNNKAEIEKFLIDHPWKFIHISNENNIIDEVFKLQLGYPTTYLLNKDAQIIKSFSGGAMGEQAIVEIQNKLVPAIENAL